MLRLISSCHCNFSVGKLRAGAPDEGVPENICSAVEIRRLAGKLLPLLVFRSVLTGCGELRKTGEKPLHEKGILASTERKKLMCYLSYLNLLLT